MKTFDPPLDALAGRELDGVRRVGKMLAVEAGELTLLVHLMSAGRLQLYDKRASLRDRSSRAAGPARRTAASCACASSAPSSAPGRSCCRADDVEADEAVATLGPDALPAAAAGGVRARCSTSRATCTRCCATSARSPASAARGSTRSSGPPACRRSSAAPTSTTRQSSALRAACDEVLGGAIDHYEEVIGDTRAGQAADAAAGAPPRRARSARAAARASRRSTSRTT